VYPEGLAHIENICANGTLLEKTYTSIKTAKTWMKDGKLYGEFIDGRLLSDYYIDLLKNDDKEGFLKLLDTHLGHLITGDNSCPFEPSGGFAEWFGSGGAEFSGQPALKFVNLDATDGNIIFENNDFNKPYFIDYEWCFDFPVPVALLKFHIIDLLFNLTLTHKLFGERESVWSLYLSEQDVADCDKARAYFFDKVHNLESVKSSVSERRNHGVRIMDIYESYMQSDISLDDERRNKEREKETALAAKDAEMTSAISEKNAVITQREAVISAKDSEIADKDAVIAENDAIIIARDATVAKRTAALAKSRQLAKNRKIRINQLNQQRIRLKKKLYKKEKKLNKILKSRTWKYGRKFARIARKIFPRKALRTKVVRSLLRPFRKKSKKSDIPFRKYEKIYFTKYENPEVTIIVPVHNNFAYTYDCLKSIHDTCGGLRYEVIVADDASSDATRKAGRKFANVRIVRNEQSLFFLRNCNRAATFAKGEYIVLLNNDTLVHEGWLESMLKLARADDTIGVVGSKLLFADGSLQEAGGIVWSDGSAWNYGREDDAEKAEYNYVKEADYVSGASMMVRKALWDEVGGFDDRYAPAYYEDSDLAFEARKRGHKVVYQPLSVVTHFEGASHGTDLKSGLKSYQIRNAKLFYNKWKEMLVTEHYPNGQHVFKARDRSKSKKTVAFVDAYLPTFDQDAGSRSIYEYVCLFIDMGYKVVFIPDNFNRMGEYAEHYQQLGVEALCGVWYRDHLNEWLVSNAEYFDVFFLARPHISINYIDIVRKNTAATILYYGVDIHFLRVQREYELTHNEELLPDIEKWKALETELIEKADCTFFPSCEEEAFAKSAFPDRCIMTLPVYIINEINRRKYSVKNREGLLFIGGFNHPPNGDAVEWFIDEVLDKVRASIPDVVFHVIGSNMPERLSERSESGVKIHGFVSVDELHGLYDSVRLTVVPLRFGGGIKGKVLESMECGAPVVTTPVGAEGYMDAEDYLAVADGADALAEKIIALYDDEAALSKMVDSGYDYIEAQFSRAHAEEFILSAIREGEKKKALREG
jgi:GT2 family glycosyltransferase